MRKKILPLALLLTLSACGAGSGKNLDTQGLPVKDNSQSSSISSSQKSTQSSAQNSSQASVQTSSQSSSSEAPVQTPGVTLASLQQNIFGAICVNCHTGSNAPRGLRLDSEANSYTFLVSRAADEVPELMRVNPGNPDASYLIRKLEGTSGIVGGRMPLGGPYLSQAQINNVRDWIANGAPRTGTGTQPTKMSKLSAEKTSEDISLTLHFSRALDADTITEKSISLDYSTPDSEKPISIANFGLLVLDQSIEIFLSQPLANAEKIGITIHTIRELPILDSEQNNLELNTNETAEGAYRYEYSLH